MRYPGRVYPRPSLGISLPVYSPALRTCILFPLTLCSEDRTGRRPWEQSKAFSREVIVRSQGFIIVVNRLKVLSDKYVITIAVSFSLP